MKIICLICLIFLFIANTIAQPQKLPFCDGVKQIQNLIQQGKFDSLKGAPDPENPKYSFISTINVEDITDETVGTNLGTYYHSEYKKCTSKTEQEKYVQELVQKLQDCFHKKAKKDDINGYKVKVGKVIFSVLELGSRAVLMFVRLDE